MTTTWNIDSAHSGVHFTARHMVITKVRGSFKTWTANLQLDDSELTRSAVDVTIDAASISTNNDMRDGHLRSADFFDVERFPSLTFRSTKVEREAADSYRVTGDLTIRDVTRQVTLDVEVEGRAKGMDGLDHIGFTAKASIDRRDFGLTWNKALEAGGVLVGDKIEIGIELQAVAAAAAVAA